MAARLEDYGLIGDCRTAALVARDGSIDWFCAPRFDSGACFAALLGTPDHGRWLIAPGSGVNVQSVSRRYRPGTLVLETDFQTDTGSFRLVDAMAIDATTPTLVRQVEGLEGRVPVRLELVIRFDYGSIVPWVRRTEIGISAIAGPDLLRLRSDVELRGENMTTVAEFEIDAGQTRGFTLAWHPSAEDEPPQAPEPAAAIAQAERFWTEWSDRCTYQGDYRDAVVRSLLTLKALTYAPSGGIAAAATTSLPEKLGGVRNWDYRYCWLRDATFTLLSLLGAGYLDEAAAWRRWLLRAVAGGPENLQIMYGLGGERRLIEYEIPWLPGYEGSHPVRVGNAAYRQFQLDVYGEVFDALFHARARGSGRSRMPGRWANPSTSSWHPPGTSRMRASGKFAAAVATSRIRR